MRGAWGLVREEQQLVCSLVLVVEYNATSGGTGRLGEARPWSQVVN